MNAVDRRRQRTGRRVGGVLCLLIGAVLVWQIGVKQDRWAQPFVGDEETQAKTILAPGLKHPAGPATADPKVAFPSIRSSISKTPQTLILTGTIVGRNAGEGTAFIGIDPGNSQTYVMGALLANGARLAGVFKDYVVLVKDGQSSRLYVLGRRGFHWLHDESGPLLTVGGTSAAAPPTLPESVEVLTDYIRPSPVYEGPVLKGYEVYPGRQAGVFYQMGLQPGDLIAAIDGLPPGDPAQAMDMFRRLPQGEVITATVLRKEQSLELSLDGTVIAAAQQRLEQARTFAPDPLASLGQRF